MKAASDPGSGLSGPDRSTPRPSDRFVGRVDELATLFAALSGVGWRDGPVRLLCGPAGVGKTRLAAELARSAGDAGHRVAWAHCPDDLTAPPYWPWTQVVRSLLGEDRGSELAALVLDEPGGAERFELFDATAATLREAAAGGPVLVVLDDLQAADEATLQLTRFVARQLHDLPVLLVATVRSTPAIDPMLEAHLDELGRSGHRLDLEALTVGAVADLVADAAPADEVHAVTGGNPLHVHQVLRELQGSPGRSPGGSVDESSGALRRAVARRVAAVGGPTRAVLDAAAVLGSPFERSELGRVVAGAAAPRPVSSDPFIETDSANPSLIDAALGELDDGGFVHRPEGRIAFRHPVVTEAVLAALDERQAHRLHAVVAEIIGDDVSRVGALAHHLLRAGPSSSLAAIEACRLAAVVASRSRAHEDAAVHLSRALRALDSTALDSTALDSTALDDRVEHDELRLDVYLELADAQWRTGETHLADAMHEAAWHTASRFGDPTSLARAVLHNGLEYYFSDHARPVLATRTEEALAAQPPGPSVLRARLLADLATHHLVSTADRGRELAEQSLVMARELGDPVAVGNALIARQVTDLGPAMLRRHIADANEILACADEADDYRLALHGRFLLMGALLQDGDIRALDTELVRLDGGLGELGEPRFDRFAQWVRATRAMLDGRATDAETLAETALAISEKMGDPDAVGVFGGQVGVVRWMQGRMLEMEPVYLAMRAAEPDEPLWPAVLAWLWATHDRPDAARGALDVVPDLSTLPAGMHWLLNAVTFAEAAALVGTDDQVEAAWSALLPYADRFVPIAMGAATWGPVARPLGHVALRRGQTEDGLDLLEMAVRTCARIGARPWLIEAQLDLADALVNHQSGDPRIIALRAEASLAADQLGLERFRRRIDAAATLDPATSEAVPGQLGDDMAFAGASPAELSGRPAVRVIGGFEVVGADGTTARWKSRKARELLKILVSRRGAPVNREELCDLLWPGEDPAAVANRLSVALSTIRRALDPQRSRPADELVSTETDVARLRLNGVDVDVDDLLTQARAVNEAARQGEPDAPKLAMALLDRHRGEAFPDEPHADWATALRHEVALAMTSLARLVASDAASRNDHLHAAEANRRILDIDPYDEAANLGVTASFRAMGAHGQADAAYATYCERMAELGVPAAPAPTA